METRFRLAVFQFAPQPFAIDANAARIAAAAGEAGAALVVTPELSLTGYDVGDDAARVARPARPGDAAPVPDLDVGPDLLVGLVERGDGARLYNTFAHLRDGRILARHRKVYLPTYGMFDEGRVFGGGDRVRAYDIGGGWRIGLLVCEDFWHPALAYVLAVAGVDAIIVAAAAPGRGLWHGGEDGGRFASRGAWTRIARTTAQLYGVYVVLANRIGAEGGLTFAGGSCIVGPSGDTLAEAPEDGEAMIEAELSLDEVARARRPFDHGRDDDPRLTIRELRRAVESDDG